MPRSIPLTRGGRRRYSHRVSAETDPQTLAAEAARTLLDRFGLTSIDVALVLGSGWSGAVSGLGEAIGECELADLPGFAREEQLVLARLVGTHRRNPILVGIEDLIPPWDRLAVYLITLLRLAVLLHRGRSATALPDIELTARGRTLEMRFPARWLKEHALSAEDLHQEIEHLHELGLKLRVYSGSRTAAA